jgi:hypothetical protein
MKKIAVRVDVFFSKSVQKSGLIDCQDRVLARISNNASHEKIFNQIDERIF